MMQDQIDGNDNDGERRQRLREASATHLSSQLAGEPDHCGSSERGQKTDRQGRFPEEMARQPAQEHGQGWMVDVSPGQPLRASQVIHLVAEDAVPSRRHQMQQELACGDVEDQSWAGGKAVLRTVGGRGGWCCQASSLIPSSNLRMISQISVISGKVLSFRDSRIQNHLAELLAL